MQLESEIGKKAPYKEGYKYGKRRKSQPFFFFFFFFFALGPANFERNWSFPIGPQRELQRIPLESISAYKYLSKKSLKDI